MKIPVVDQELCIGCGSCETICAPVFKVIDDKSHVIGPERCGECDCLMAADLCPVAAITLREE